MTDRTRPTRADARRNYDAVLSAAVRVLAARPDASMREIAEASGVGRTTVYRHFPQREDLVLALYRLVLDDAQEIVVAAVTAGRAAWARADAGSTADDGPAPRSDHDPADGELATAGRDAAGSGPGADGTARTALDVVVAMTSRLGELGERYRFLGAHREIQSEIEALAAAQGTEPLASYLDEARERGELRRDLSVVWMLDVLHHLTMAAAVNLRNDSSPPSELRRMLAATIRSALAPVDCASRPAD